MADDFAGEGGGRTWDVAIALVLALLFAFAGVASHGLWTPDEPRDAAIGLSMARSGDLIIPRLNGVPFLEKPPLYWWCASALDRALGVDRLSPGDWRRDAVARLPSALFGAAALLVAFALGKRLSGRRGAYLALGVLASMVEFGEVTGRVIVDPALVFAVGLGHLVHSELNAFLGIFHGTQKGSR